MGCFRSLRHLLEHNFRSMVQPRWTKRGKGRGFSRSKTAASKDATTIGNTFPSPGSPQNLHQQGSPMRDYIDDKQTDSELCTINSSETGSEATQPYVNRLGDESKEGIQWESTLRDDLCDARIEWPKGSFRYFIPIDDLNRLITAKSIFAELARFGVEFASQEGIVRKILQVAPKLFAILVCLKRGHHIVEFLDEGLDDTDLPFVRSDKTSKSGTFKLCSKKSPDQPIKCMTAWHQTRVNDFGRDQWCMFAPIFEYRDEIEHYELEDNCVLPWIEDGERSDKAIEGGFGSVWKIAIHPAHQRASESVNQKLLSRFVALKRLHTTDEKSFVSEVEMLKLLNKRRHSHVVTLLATFRLNGRYYLLFPYADFNLRQYWKHTPIPDFSQATVSWMLHQCKAIASALHTVHEYQSTRDWLESDSNTNSSGFIYGRHGDIKAENILWYADQGIMDEKGLLVIADFGLTAFHNKNSRSNVNARHVTGSPSYEPPELMLHSKISRAYDIWSLGCLYLEFVTWLVCGWEHLNQFPKAREMETSPAMIDDTFFTIVETEHRPVVRQSVQEWMNDLHEMPRCSAFVHDILSLISEDMLVVNPKVRIRTGHLNIRLGDMVHKSRKQPHYLTDPKPSTPRAQQPNPWSLAAFQRKSHSKCPDPKDGVPLPQRPNDVSGDRTMAQISPQIQPVLFTDISPPSSPRTSFSGT